MKINWGPALEIETKFAVVMLEQAARGVAFDLDLAYQTLEELDQDKEKIYQEIRPHLKLVVLCEHPKDSETGEYKYVSKFKKKNGEYTNGVIKTFRNANLNDPTFDIWGAYSRVKFEEPKLTKRVQLIKQLLRDHGWRPKIFTETGIPKLTNEGVPVESLSGIKGPIGELLGLYYVYCHRESAVKGFIRNLRPDGRLSAQGDSCGTNTTRVRHRILVNIPKAKDSIIYGSRMRSLFTVREGFKMLGADASGLEARMMGHYTFPFDDGELAHEMLHGDIHTKTSNSLQIDRDLAKKIFYALLYGAQVAKVQAILKCTKKRAQEVFNNFWAELESMARIRDLVIHAYKKYGFIKGLDGRKIFPRSEHSALNALFQSGGSIVIKHATVDLNERVQGERMYQVIHMHDEYQFEIANNLCYKEGDELKSAYGDLACQCIIDAGESLNLRVPLDAEYKIGNNWAETH